ncbi:hypothetical protein CHU92_00175 [Flavobacterium cyanobacteriorum]|uniref:Uncharacterized protein n=1 Tax=Flavobacterium cyanobacteriorum TaxID=2022802 RepID=A0A256A8P5_9FLAO|nr:hypothetical protein [Flavobacterium cyanobacteriorum]OYQ50031.1 hypothetical protein CHU92_00175 [Flavobacterium cyanobacteriorum]
MEIKELFKFLPFMCAGEIHVLDKNGNKIKTYVFSDKNASNQLDCLSRFSKAVATVDASLREGETTSGTVSYLP